MTANLELYSLYKLYLEQNQNKTFLDKQKNQKFYYNRSLLKEVNQYTTEELQKEKWKLKNKDETQSHVEQRKWLTFNKI